MILWAFLFLRQLQLSKQLSISGSVGVLSPSRQRRLSAFCETDSTVVEQVIEPHTQSPELSHHPRQRRIDEIVVLGV